MNSKLNISLFILLLILEHISFAQQPISFFKNANIDSLVSTSDWSIGRPLEFDDKYIISVSYGGFGINEPKEMFGVYDKKGELLDTIRFELFDNYESTANTFKKWGTDSLIYCGRIFSVNTFVNKAATFLLDKDFNVLWKLSPDTGFYDLNPINDSIAIGYSYGTSAINQPYIGYINYKTGKIKQIKFLNEFDCYPFGLSDSLFIIRYCQISDNNLWILLREKNNNVRSLINYNFQTNHCVNFDDLSSIIFLENYFDNILFLDRIHNGGVASDLVSLDVGNDTVFTFTDIGLLDSSSYNIISASYLSNKIHVLSTYKSNSTSIGIINQLSLSGELLSQIELIDLATDALNPNADYHYIFEPVSMIPTTDGGYLFIVKVKNSGTHFIMKMDSTFHVRNSDYGVYIGVEKPLMAEKNSNISLFPNPTTSHFTIQGNSTIKNLIVYNLQGQQLFQKNNLNTNNYTVEEQLPSGVFVVKVETAEGVEVRKVLVK